jgi:hypothetical protein
MIMKMNKATVVIQTSPDSTQTSTSTLPSEQNDAIAQHRQKIATANRQSTLTNTDSRIPTNGYGGSYGYTEESFTRSMSNNPWSPDFRPLQQ